MNWDQVLWCMKTMLLYAPSNPADRTGSAKDFPLAEFCRKVKWSTVLKYSCKIHCTASGSNFYQQNRLAATRQDSRVGSSVATKKKKKPEADISHKLR